MAHWMPATSSRKPIRSKPQYQRNQFGASVGGPVRKNRSFFFADYEGRRVRQGITQVSNVPTLAERTGDFSADNQPVINPFTQQPFRGQDSFSLSESGGRGHCCALSDPQPCGSGRKLCFLADRARS